MALLRPHFIATNSHYIPGRGSSHIKVPCESLYKQTLATSLQLPETPMAVPHLFVSMPEHSSHTRQGNRAAPPKYKGGICGLLPAAFMVNKDI